MKSFTTDGVQWAWDATSISAATECPRKYQYTILLGWVFDGQEPKDLRFGRHFATAVEHYYKHVIVKNKSHEEALHLIVREAMLETWDHELGEPEELDGEDGLTKTHGSLQRIPETGSPWESNDPIKNRWNLIRTIIWYFCHYIESNHETTSVVTLNDGKPAVELSFEFQLSKDITYCGHFDRLIAGQTGDIFVMDQKTTGSGLNEWYFKGFDRSIQMSGYSLAGSILFGSPIRGVMIDAAQIQVGGTTFMRGETYRTEEQLEEWLQETEMIIKRMQDYTVSGFFPRDTTACGYYGGCVFKDICAMSPSNRDRFLKGGFAKRKRWDPIERR